MKNFLKIWGAVTLVMVVIGVIGVGFGAFLAFSPVYVSIPFAVLCATAFISGILYYGEYHDD